MYDPEFAAVVLAATWGARLYPLTSSGVEEDTYDDFSDGDNSLNKQSNSDDDDSDKKEEGREIDANDEEKKYRPKHLLPLIGRSLLYHLILHLKKRKIELCIIAIGADDDNVTLSSLIDEMSSHGFSPQVTKLSSTGEDDDKIVRITLDKMSLVVAKLPTDCYGSADALRHLSDLVDEKNKAPILPSSSHVMIMPADLILYGDLNGEGDALGSLADAHRFGCQTVHQMPGQGPPSAITMLLTDVGDFDDNGIPLKESSKAKKGGLAREDEEIEYIALSPTTTMVKRPLPPQRIILKQSKYNVEEDEDNTGSTPKLNIPMSRLRLSPMNQITIRIDWSDVHVFVFSPWILKLLHARPNIKDISKELVPLLVNRQFRGVKAAFGCHNTHNANSNATTDHTDDKEKNLLLDQVLNEPPFALYQGNHMNQMTSFVGGGVDGNSGGDTKEEDDLDNCGTQRSVDYPFVVAAKVLPRSLSKLTLRACTIPAYLYGCREVAVHAITEASPSPQSCSSDKKGIPQTQGAKLDNLKLNIPLPDGSVTNAKFNHIILQGATMGNRVHVKSSTIGRRSKLGSRCRLNNVVVMDDVTIGENCVLQNSILGSGSVIGDNCNLNECQVGPKYIVPAGTKSKDESFS